jgi:hypothetical protein
VHLRLKQKIQEMLFKMSNDNKNIPQMTYQQVVSFLTLKVTAIESVLIKKNLITEDEVKAEFMKSVELAEELQNSLESENVKPRIIN